MFAWNSFKHSLEKSCMSACPKRIRSLIKPWLTNNFFTKSKALAHERAQFALVGLFSGLGITLNFSGSDPGAQKQPKKKEKPFTKATFSFSFFSSSSSPLSLFLSFFLAFSAPLIKKLEVQKVTQSTCWTPPPKSITRTTSTATTTSTRSATSSPAKKQLQN